MDNDDDYLWISASFSLAVVLEIALVIAWIWTNIVWPGQIGLSVEESTRRMAEGISFWKWQKIVFGTVLLTGFFLWFVRRWEAILGWFYSLTPHPAAKMADRLLYGDEQLDVEAFKRALKFQSRNPIEQAVREQQAREALEKLRRREEQLREEEQRRVAEDARAKAELANLKRENAFNALQDELLNAALDYEIRRTRLDVVRKEGRRK